MDGAGDALYGDAGRGLETPEERKNRYEQARRSPGKMRPVERQIGSVTWSRWVKPGSSSVEREDLIDSVVADDDDEEERDA